MIGSGPLPTLIFKCRNKWCFFGTVFVHNMVCRYNRNFTSYLILWALGRHYRPAENTLFFFFVFTVQQRDLTIWIYFFFTLLTTCVLHSVTIMVTIYWATTMRQNITNIYVCMCVCVCVCVCIYIHTLTYIYLHI